MTTLIADQRVASVPIKDAGEPLVRLDWIAGPATGAGRFVRSGLAERLAVAQDLLPEGLHLSLAEGYRAASVQRAIEVEYAEELRALHPGIDERELGLLTSRYVAPLHVAPHVAGAAVDITLVDADGNELDLGTAIDATPEESGGACFFDASVGKRARRHRMMLAESLTAAGLVNYPTEWWHWSFGDRYWAYLTGADHAQYGPVTS